MPDHVRKTITDLELRLHQQEAQVEETKRLINSLAALVGDAPPYLASEAQQASANGAIRPDQFYGRPLATVIKEYLDMRKASGRGPATVPEIYGALVQGGYPFETRDPENAKRGLRISLAKNSYQFHRLPDGHHYGLLDWYPEVKDRRGKRAAEQAPPDAPGAEDKEARNQSTKPD
jgi:hypothetical protein